MKAKDIFKIAKELPKKELYTLISLIENHISRHKKAVKTTKPIITDIEVLFLFPSNHEVDNILYEELESV